MSKLCCLALCRGDRHPSCCRFMPTSLSGCKIYSDCINWYEDEISLTDMLVLFRHKPKRETKLKHIPYATQMAGNKSSHPRFDTWRGLALLDAWIRIRSLFTRETLTPPYKKNVNKEVIDLIRYETPRNWQTRIFRCSSCLLLLSRVQTLRVHFMHLHVPFYAPS